MVAHFKLFQRSLILIFFLFIGILLYVLYYANTKKSGVTGLNMSHIQEMRVNFERGKQPKNQIQRIL